MPAELCLENHERTLGHQYALNSAVETESAAFPFIANEIPEEAVDAEGNRTMSGEVKLAVFGFSFITTKCQCGFVHCLQQSLQSFH